MTLSKNALQKPVLDTAKDLRCFNSLSIRLIIYNANLSETTSSQSQNRNTRKQKHL